MMSDNAHIFFGSLEHAERVKLEQGVAAGAAAGKHMVSDAIQAGIRAGNINISASGTQVRMALSSSSESSIAKTEDLQRQVEARRIARTIVVPTLDLQVRQALRDRGEPITLFGERAPERRERLQQIMALLVASGAVSDAQSVLTHRDQKSHAAAVAEEREKLRTLMDMDAPATSAAVSAPPTMVFSEGSPQLHEARVFLAQYSLPRAQARLELAREPANAPRIQSRFASLQSVQRMSAQLTEVGCARPLACCAFSASGAHLATASWAGVLKVWDIPSGRLSTTIKAHNDRISDVAFHPASGLAEHSAHACNLATAGTDGCVRLWALTPDPAHSSLQTSSSSSLSLSSSCSAAASSHSASNAELAADAVADSNLSDPDNAESHNMQVIAGAPGTGGVSAQANAALTLSTQQPLAALSGHFERCTRLAWHPHGRYLVSGSFDRTWRLWDVETQSCLCIQDGHHDPIFGLAIHPDGSLLASGDLGGTVRLWDLRTGRSVFDMQQHIKQVNAIDFHPNGHYVATGSDDHTVLMWDLRKRTSFYTIPAHTHLISNVRFQPGGGAFLMTSSYDKTCKVFSCQDWSLVKTFSGHDDKIMRAEISPDSKHIATVCWDRTWKLWSE